MYQRKKFIPNQINPFLKEKAMEMTAERFIEIREILKKKLEECRKSKVRLNATIAGRINSLLCLTELDELTEYVGIPADELREYKELKTRNERIRYRLEDVKKQGYPIGISSQKDIFSLFSFIPGDLMIEHRFNQRLKNILAFGMFAKVIGFPPEELIFFKATISKELNSILFNEKHWPINRWPA